MEKKYLKKTLVPLKIYLKDRKRSYQIKKIKDYIKKKGIVNPNNLSILTICATVIYKNNY